MVAPRYEYNPPAPNHTLPSTKTQFEQAVNLQLIMKSSIVGLAFTTLLAAAAAQKTGTTAVPSKNSIDKKRAAAAGKLLRPPDEFDKR